MFVLARTKVRFKIYRCLQSVIGIHYASEFMQVINELSLGYDIFDSSMPAEQGIKTITIPSV